MTARAAGALIACALALSACATAPADRRLETDSTTSRAAGFRVWWKEGAWHLRAGGGTRPHRYQGTLSGTNGSVTSARPTDSALRDHVALVGDAVQFDFEATDDEGFDAEVAGGCVRLDLLLDGKRRPDRVYEGAAAAAPAHVPFEICRDP